MSTPKYAFEKKITENLDKLVYMDGPNVFQFYLEIERFNKIELYGFKSSKLMQKVSKYLFKSRID